jgi:hypothetical protein
VSRKLALAASWESQNATFMYVTCVVQVKGWTGYMRDVDVLKNVKLLIIADSSPLSLSRTSLLYPTPYAERNSMLRFVDAHTKFPVVKFQFVGMKLHLILSYHECHAVSNHSLCQ